MLFSAIVSDIQFQTSGSYSIKQKNSHQHAYYSQEIIRMLVSFFCVLRIVYGPFILLFSCSKIKAKRSSKTKKLQIQGVRFVHIADSMADFENVMFKIGLHLPQGGGGVEISDRILQNFALSVSHVMRPPSYTVRKNPVTEKNTRFLLILPLSAQK